MFRDGQSVYTGAWRVKRTQQTVGGARVTPRTIQPGDNAGSESRSAQGDRKSVAEIPPPTGPFIVGRTSFYWKDPARPETLTDDPNDRRELMVTLWYPARKVDGLAQAAPNAC